MTLIRVPKRWQLPESSATPEHIYRDRRRFMKNLGLGAIGASVLGPGCFLSVDGAEGNIAGTGGGFGGDNDLYPATRNDGYAVTERDLTPLEDATRFNNFYEFTTAKNRVWELVDQFVIEPWTVEVKGNVHRPQTIDLEQLLRQVTLQERIYRFRCVEAWAMTVPWTGFPLSELINLVEPMSNANYIRFVTALRPEQMPGIDAAPGMPWPYFEGLRMDEAMNELTMLVTGLYGGPVPKQNGAPLRLITPWKYGYKSIKSIVEIEFLESEPPTFWNTLVPHEYGFLSNVDPSVPHPRWSQAHERLIGTDETVDTLPFNGYEAEVAGLYSAASRL